MGSIWLFQFLESEGNSRSEILSLSPGRSTVPGSAGPRMISAQGFPLCVPGQGTPPWGCQSCVTLGDGAQEGPGPAEQSVGPCPCVTPSSRHPTTQGCDCSCAGAGWEPAEMFLCCLALSGAATSPRCLSGPTRVTHTLNINVAAHFPPWQRWELSFCMELGT